MVTLCCRYSYIDKHCSSYILSLTSRGWWRKCLWVIFKSLGFTQREQLCEGCIVSSQAWGWFNTGNRDTHFTPSWRVCWLKTWSNQRETRWGWIDSPRCSSQCTSHADMIVSVCNRGTKSSQTEGFYLSCFSSHCDRCESLHILWKQLQHLDSDLIYLVTLLMGQPGDSSNKQEMWILSTSYAPSQQMELFVCCFCSLKQSVGNQEGRSLTGGSLWLWTLDKSELLIPGRTQAVTDTHTGFEGTVTLEATEWERPMYLRVAEMTGRCWQM